jgi:hypothetical protein
VPREARLANAYAQRKKDPAGARAEIERVVQALIAKGAVKSAGLGDVDGYIVLGRTMAALTTEWTPWEYRTWFFDPATGEPLYFAPELELVRGGPALDGRFVAEAQSAVGPLTLFDPALGDFEDPPVALFAVHPDGHRGYALVDCRIIEWSLDTGTTIRPLGRRTGAPLPSDDPACWVYDYRDAAVTADGKWLTTRWGRWDLATGAHRPLPFPVGDYDRSVAVSPDGRYVAHVVPFPEPPKGEFPKATVLRLYDLTLGTVKAASRKMEALSNGDPLSFGWAPLRVCVFDYFFLVFTVPDLRVIQVGDKALKKDALTHFGPTSCKDWFLPPANYPKERARLASRVCSISGILIPLESCPPG